MHLRRLLTLALIGVVAAGPEAAITLADPTVGFQVWMVLQLLGVIVAAIGIAAAFSVLGLGIVRVLTWPLRDRPSTFVAWSFLRAARLRDPVPVRLLRGVRDALDAGPLASREGGMRKLGVGLLCLALGAGGVMLWQGGGGSSVAEQTALLAVRNVGVACGLHGLLLLAASPPWRPLRWALPVLLGFAALAGVVALGQIPVLAPYVSGVGLALGMLATVVAVQRILRLPRHGRDRIARRRGLLLMPFAGLLVGLGAALPSAGVLEAAHGLVLLQAGVPLTLGAVYLLLHGQARVSVPVFVAIVGVAAGTWALIVVLSVMGGFAADLRAKMLVANAHALVERPGGQAPIRDAARLSQALRAASGVVAVSPQVRGDAILGSAFNVHNFVSLRGVDPELPEVREAIGETLVTGSLALLQAPERMGRPQHFARIDREEMHDVPPPPEVTATGAGPGAGVGEDDIDALLELAPGPAEPQPPRPPIVLPSGAAAVPPVDSADAPAGDPPPLLGGSGALGGLGDAELLEAIRVDAAKDPGGIALPDSPAADARPGRLLDLPLFDEEADVPVAPGILLGVELARSLQVDLGDRVEVITPDADIGPTGLRPRLRTFRVAGVFETGLYEADSKVAYIDVAEASRYFNLDGAVNVVELRLQQPEEPDPALGAVRRALSGSAVGKGLRVVDWRELNRSLFSALAFERLVIFLVLGLIILVASFAIVSALTMVILQKQAGIAMLAAMGGTARTIANAFVQMGFVIGAIGTTAGLVLGLGTCGLIGTLGIKLPDAYYVRELPVAVAPVEVAAVVVAALGVSLVATAFPARTAARSRPLEGLRHD
ncbi:MAG: hypothetical protein RIT45_4241 [Pseudomonadota bacterium]